MFKIRDTKIKFYFITTVTQSRTLLPQESLRIWNINFAIKRGPISFQR